jgi:exonuclease SbcD
MLTILHFADAHIDMANYGRHDPESGLPLRVLDFLKSLDTIVDTAIQEKVDLVLFAGDAYKDRNPAPTFQREWEKRMMRLSRAGIPTLLLVGNHDISPSIGRAHAIEELATLEVPHIRVLDKPIFLGPEDLEGLPLQVIAIPWIARSGMMAALGLSAADPSQVYQQLEERIAELINAWLGEADPALPVVFTAHCSIQGAKFGVERTVMLGSDLVLSPSLVRDARLDYVALGHIHKPQNLNENAHPPVIYPGSIERVDFGEVVDDKYFVIARVERGHSEVEWRQLKGVRPFFDRSFVVTSQEDVTGQICRALPEPDDLAEAVVRLILEYPRDWETLIDDGALHEHCSQAFEFHLVKRPQVEGRVRLPGDQSIGSMAPLELLAQYWQSGHVDPGDSAELNKLAAQIIQDELGDLSPEGA